MTRLALVAVPDLFFLTRIQSVAEISGIALEACPLESLAARAAERSPDVIVIDLHGPGDPIGIASELKRGAATSSIPIVGFYSHVETETRERALAAGIDRVLPRSAFSARLAEWLTRPV